MNDINHLRSFGRFLYTQNPFYLISCGFIIYGLQAATQTIGDMFSRGLVLSAGLSAYTLLMALTVIAVVRCAQVWDDARSIYLVVLIAIVSLSSGLDELCVVNWRAATCLLSVAFSFAVIVIEVVLRASRIRFGSGYRVPLYALLLVFFVTPSLAGYLLRNEYIGNRNWTAMWFSCAIALATLFLIPAIRMGRVGTRGSGTPWSWPIYPLSAFVILFVLAAIRTHAVWMSFSADYLTVSFEPFLLMPMAVAVLVLVVESDARKRLRRRSAAAVIFAPAILLFGMSNGGQTYLPTRIEMQSLFGSATTLGLITLACFYSYTCIRSVRGSAFAIVASVFSLGAFGLPLGLAAELGLQGWMICVVASVVALANCFTKPSSDGRWFAFACLSAATIIVAGLQLDDAQRFLVASAVFLLVVTMAIAACFDTRLSQSVRVCVATTSTCLAAAATAWNLDQPTPTWSPLVFLAAGLVAILYCRVVRRTGWLYIAAIQMACGLAIFMMMVRGNASWITFVETYWPIQVGVGSFFAGLSITSLKTGVHRQVSYRMRRRIRRSKFKKGF